MYDYALAVQAVDPSAFGTVPSGGDKPSPVFVAHLYFAYCNDVVPAEAVLDENSYGTVYFVPVETGQYEGEVFFAFPIFVAEDYPAVVTVRKRVDKRIVPLGDGEILLVIVKSDALKRVKTRITSDAHIVHHLVSYY